MRKRNDNHSAGGTSRGRVDKLVPSRPRQWHRHGHPLEGPGQDELAESLNLEDIIVPQSAFLDMGPGGRLAQGVKRLYLPVRSVPPFGLSSRQRCLLDALGAGPAKLKIENKPDKNNPNLRRNRVVFVTSM
jgi:hypothetical protein